MRYGRGFITLLAALFVLICGDNPANAGKYASIVIDAETGKIHHEANPDVITHPASLTKMMTLYMAFEALERGKLKMEDALKVSKHASVQAPSKLYLKPGTTITVKQAVLALVTKSANDAAVVLAEKLGGTETSFAIKMTSKAKALGMSNTVFKNASGLPNPKQITTARDMATLSQALYKDFPEYFKYFKQQSFVYKGQKHNNHNKLLGKVKGVDGIKTGFINASGFNLAASVVRNNRRIIAVVMGGKTSRSRDQHMVDLLENTYKKFAGYKDDLVDMVKSRKSVEAPDSINSEWKATKVAGAKSSKESKTTKIAGVQAPVPPVKPSKSKLAPVAVAAKSSSKSSAKSTTLAAASPVLPEVCVPLPPRNQVTANQTRKASHEAENLDRLFAEFGYADDGGTDGTLAHLIKKVSHE